MASLFFAAKPSPEMRLAIAALGERLARAHGLQGHVMDAGRLHLTLAAAWAERLSLQEAIWRAQMLAPEIRGAACSVCFDAVGSFRNPDRHPLLRGEGMKELAALRARLRARMQRAGFAVASGFTPHMTLMWADRQVEDHPIAPISWPVEDFELILSTGGRHIRLGRWPLLRQSADGQIADMAAIARSVPATDLDQVMPQRR
jgi:2'-5' RNA ligase